MRISSALVLAAAFLAGSSTPVAAQKMGGQLTAYFTDGRNVTTTLPDGTQSSTFVPYALGSDSAQSLSSAYANGASSVTNVFQSTGEWEFNTGGTPRTLLIDLTDGTLNRPFDRGFVHARFITHCFQLEGNYRNYPAIGNMKGMGSVMVCPATVRFEYGASTFYQLRMSVQKGTGDNVRFECVGVSGSVTDPTSPCNTWRITPSAASGSNRSSLYKNVSTKSSVTSTYQGDTNVTFDIRLEKR